MMTANFLIETIFMIFIKILAGIILIVLMLVVLKEAIDIIKLNRKHGEQRNEREESKMSVSKWDYIPEKCDGDYCPGDCDNCSKANEDEREDNEE